MGKGIVFGGGPSLLIRKKDDGVNEGKKWNITLALQLTIHM